MNRTGQYVEFARFRTKAGVTEEQLLRAEERVRAGMPKTFEGYLGRELFQSEAGEWTVVLRFLTRANMEALLAKLKVAPDASFRELGALIDQDTMRVDLAWMQT